MANNQTTVILFRGRPGVGKTTVSNIFAESRSLLILRKDDIYDVSSAYVNEHQTRNKISYDSMFKILETNSVLGTKFVLDFPFNKTEEINNLYEWCSKFGIKLVSILVICSDRELWESRFDKRSENPLPNQLITNLNDLEKHYGDLNIQPLENEVVVDTVNSVEEIKKQLENLVI